MHTSRLLGWLVAGALLAGAPVRAETLHVDTPQGAREAILLPAPTAPASTVIVLHGATTTAAWTARSSGFAEAAAARAFTAVFPQGINRQWNDGREGRMSDIDDVGFLRRLVADLTGRGIADPARVYLAGISNGGMMTFRMLCEASELFAGAATIIANMPAGIGEGCRLRKPLPVVMFNGTADPLVPYEGGGVGFRGERGLVWAAERTARFLARSNVCGPVATTALGVRVTRLDWSGCRAAPGVRLYRFEGGGHQVPGRREILPRLLGPGLLGISAAKEALEFLAP